MQVTIRQVILHYHGTFSAIIPLHWQMFTIYRGKVISVIHSITASSSSDAILKYIRLK
jgi:hypothetical protein